MPLRGSQRGGVFRRHPRGEDPQGYLLDLASHIVETKAAHFDPSKFDDRYEDALKDLLRKKQEGKPIERVWTPIVSSGDVAVMVSRLRQRALVTGPMDEDRGLTCAVNW